MKKELEIITPIVVNFIKVGENSYPLTAFTDDELREIGVDNHD